MAIFHQFQLYDKFMQSNAKANIYVTYTTSRFNDALNEIKIINNFRHKKGGKNPI